MEEKTNTVDLSLIQEKIDSQNKLLETIRDEIQNANERENNELADKIKQKEEADKKEQERIKNGELTTEEQILKELQSISSSTSNQNKTLNQFVDDLLRKVESGNTSSKEASEQLRTLVEINQNSSHFSETQTNLLATYAIVIIPVFVVLVLIYRFFRQFI